MQFSFYSWEFAKDDDRLWVDFAAIAPEVDDALAAAVLTPLRAKIAELSLARTKVGDATLVLCAQMPELRQLDLRGTKVSSVGLRSLAGHLKLAVLGLGETALHGDIVETLASLRALKSANLWRSDVDAVALAALRARCNQARIEAGDSLMTAVLEEESPPKMSNDAPLADAPKAAVAGAAPVNAKCPVTGKPVDPKHTLVDGGRTIGFCCDQCAAKFQATPEQFRAAIR